MARTTEAVPVDDPAFKAAKRQAGEFAAIFGGLQVVTEAELAIRGSGRSP